MSGRPSVSVSLKPVGGSKEDRVYFMAGWENDEGRVTGLKFDRRVRGLKVLLDDGSELRVDVPADGKPSHYIDFYDARQSDGRSGGSRGGRSGGGGEW